MSRSKHTEVQIIASLKQVEAGRTVDDVARECGVSAATIYAWKAKYGGLDISEAQRLRSLDDENIDVFRNPCVRKAEAHRRDILYTLRSAMPIASTLPLSPRWLLLQISLNCRVFYR